MSEPAGRTHALVLAGGAAYAAYEVGVVRALLTGVCPSTDHEALSPRIFSGSSAGAFNAATLVSAADGGMDGAVERLECTWLEEIANAPQSCGNGVYRFRFDPTRFVDPGCFTTARDLPFVQFAEDAAYVATDLTRRAVNLLTADAALQQRLLELIDVESFVSVDPFRRVLRRVIAPDTIRRSDRILQIAAINWRTGALRMFGNADFTDDERVGIVQAATAVPGLFPSVDIEGEPYADASFVLNAPLKQPIDAGADVLHVVYFNPDVETLPLPRLRNTVSTLNRALLITLGAMMNRDIETASRVNLGLDALRRPAGPLSAAESRGLLHETGSQEAREQPSAPHRHVAIHRYHAREPFGATYQWLSFGRDHLAALIAQGFEDATRHDCVANRCITQ